jgi:adenylate cyclase
MGTEIERKFLLRDARWRAQVTRRERLSQGYLGGERCSVRVRLAGEHAFLTIKSQSLGIQRDEFEYPIPPEDAEAMLAGYCEQRVEKVRHFVTIGAHLWEIDEFTGDNAGLVVAEIELDAPDETFERPAWLGDEVTEDARYYNINLVREPFARWPDRDSLRAKD